MAYSTNIYDLYKKVEENHMEIHQRLHDAKKITKKERDKLDSSRITSPLVPAFDAHVIDTSFIDADELLLKVSKIIEGI